MEELDMLVDCVIISLKLLLDSYNRGSMEYEVLESNARLKIGFLNENILQISCPDKRAAVRALLAEYGQILTNSFESPSGYNT